MNNATVTAEDRTKGQSITEQPAVERRKKPKRLLEKETTVQALKQAFVMLRPDVQWKNPVMFVVEVGAFLTLLFIMQAAFGKAASQVPISYFISLDVWLFLTVLFANFATALAEARGKAQAQSLRHARHETIGLSPEDGGRHRGGFIGGSETGRPGRRGGRAD